MCRKSFFIFYKYMTMKTLKLLLPVVFLVLLIASCQYDFILPPVTPPPIDSTQVISFSAQVEPIFTTEGCIQCHKTGGQMPDLTTGNAFNSLNSTRYINKTTPEESLIYLYPNPESATHTWKKYTAADAQIVLQWIKQGAENN